jgi:hypothetical protein
MKTHGPLVETFGAGHLSAWQMGRRDFHARVARSDNPFGVADTHAHNCWLAGWLDAEDEDFSDRLAVLNRNAIFGPFAA